MVCLAKLNTQSDSSPSGINENKKEKGIPLGSDSSELIEKKKIGQTFEDLYKYKEMEVK